MQNQNIYNVLFVIGTMIINANQRRFVALVPSARNIGACAQAASVAGSQTWRGWHFMLSRISFLFFEYLWHWRAAICARKRTVVEAFYWLRHQACNQNGLAR